MKCVNVRGKPFEGFEIQKSKNVFLIVMVSVLFLYFKTAAEYCSAVLSYAQCSAEVSHRLLCESNKKTVFGPDD